MNEPTWCDRNTTPNSIDIQRVPKKVATRLEVSGTVDSQNRPSSALSTMTVGGVIGRNSSPRKMKQRPK